MSTLVILADGNPELRLRSEPVAEDGIKGVADLSRDLRETLNSHPNGVALAAPQCGVRLRVFVIKAGLARANNIDHTLVNPSWTPFGQKEPMGEGCLSFEGVNVVKARFRAVKVTYTTLQGKKVTKTVTNKLIAQIIQHEVEHLDGVLLTDK